MHAWWVFLAFGAGLLQSGRNGLARSLSGVVSPALNSWSRFAFNLPFSTALITVLFATRGVLQVSPLFFVLCLGTGVTQLLGNVALIAAFRHTSFAQAIVLHKLEIVFTAIIGALIFSELPTPVGWIGVLLSAAGAVFMQLARAPEKRHLFRRDSGSLLAIVAGLFLVFASFLLKEAIYVLVELNSRVGESRFEVACHTVFHVTWMEVVLLTLWLRLRRPGELSLVPTHFRRMLLIGLFGFLGSLGWFWAYCCFLY